MLLDKLAQCMIALQGCSNVFKRIPTVDHHSQACRQCKVTVFEKIRAVLEGRATFQSMSNIRVPRAWMFGTRTAWHDQDVVGLFVKNAARVDDDAWMAWWITNTIGGEEDKRYPSQRAFFDRVIARYGMTVVRPSMKDRPSAPASAAAIQELSASFEARRSTKSEQPTPDVGDLQPDAVQTPATQETVPPAEPSADEKAATAGPAHESKAAKKRRQKKADAPSERPEAVKAEADVKAEVKK